MRNSKTENSYTATPAAEPCTAMRSQFDAWPELEEAARAVVRAHAGGCTCCSRALVASEAVERVLSVGKPSYAALTPRTTFEDLLARQHEARTARRAAGTGWRQAWTQPATLVSALAAAVLAIGLSLAWWGAAETDRVPKDSSIGHGLSGGGVSGGGAAGPALSGPASKESPPVASSPVGPTSAPASAASGEPSLSRSASATLTSSLSLVGRQIRGVRIAPPSAPTGGWRPSLPPSPRRPTVLPRPGASRPPEPGR